MSKRIARWAVIAVATTLVVVLGGCDWPNFRSNIIEYKGAEFEVGNVYVLTYPFSDPGHDVGIYLTEDSLTIDQNGDFSGVGAYVYATVHLAAPSLQAGDYSFNDSGIDVLHRMSAGGVRVNYPQAPAEVPATGGETVVSQSDVSGEWIIEITLMGPDAETEAYYRGEITDTISVSP